MGRKRGDGVLPDIPQGVEIARARGRVYYYWNPHRGTARQAERVKLPNAKTDPAAFWREVARYAKLGAPAFQPGSIGALIDRYEASADYKRNAESTQASYGVHLRRFRAAWGPLAACDLTGEVVMHLRDGMADVPGMANHMLSCGRTIWTWAGPLGLVTGNPFAGVADLATRDTGHIPWPAFVVEHVCRHAPPDLVRMVRLGIATCQRESDLIRMGPVHRDAAGLWCRPKKTRKKRKAFCIPLSAADAIMLDRWAERPLVFTASRWKQPLERHRDDLYLYSPRGAPYSETSLRARWHRWLNGADHGRLLRSRWQAWVAEQIIKYEWDIDPEDATYPTIHGLRGTGILVRWASGFGVDQIANDIGMSRQMVDRYMRFRDQMQIAAAGPARLKLITGGAAQAGYCDDPAKD